MRTKITEVKSIPLPLGYSAEDVLEVLRKELKKDFNRIRKIWVAYGHVEVEREELV